MTQHDTADREIRGVASHTLWGLEIPIRSIWRQLLRGAALPDPIPALITRVVRSTGLWSREKREVTRELITHFSDAIAAGRTPEAACESFGEARQAAKLIRRSMRRKRPWWWQAQRNIQRAIGWMFCGLIAVYFYFVVLTIIGQPKIARFYAAEHNARVLTIPDSIRAWPDYVNAKTLLGPIPDSLWKPEPGSQTSDLGKFWPSKPGDPNWSEASAWIDAHADAVAALHAAASKPNFGVPYYARTAKTPVDYWRAEPNGTDLSTFSLAGKDTRLLDVILPELADTRFLARVMIVEARRAAELRDQPRTLRAFATIVGMARHVAEGDLLIHQLVSMSISQVVLDEIQTQLSSNLFDAPHLAQLAHIANRLDDATLSVHFDGERLFMKDMLQRCYTVNGKGDGRLTFAGLREMYTIQQVNIGTGQSESPVGSAFVTMGAPLAVAATHSRQDTWEVCSRGYDAAESEARIPLWLRGDNTLDIDVERMREDWFTFKRKHFLPSLLMPALGKAVTIPERARQIRDGALVAIALEAFRATNGVYPATLDQLVPRFLLSLPPDRFDGKPIKYRLIGEGSDVRPLVYSIGVDRIDDGGVGPAGPADYGYVSTFRSPAHIKAILADPRTSKPYRGDWLLYNPGASKQPLAAFPAQKQESGVEPDSPSIY